MYSYVKAVALNRTIGSQWTEVNLKDTIVSEILTAYSSVYLELSNPVLENNVYVDLHSIQDMDVNESITLNALLTAIGDTTLKYVDTLPSSDIKYAKYADAVYTGYKIQTCKMGYNLPPNSSILDYTDLVINRPSYSTDLTFLHTHCLISVNGYYHMTDTDGSLAYVVDGCKSLYKSRSNQLGILSFMDIGKLTKVKITPDSIRPFNVTDKLKDKIYFEVDADFTNKSFILVLGGYLVFPQDNIFWKRGDKSFALNLNFLTYVERINESELYLDLNELGLGSDPVNPTVINTEEVWSDEVITKYLTMSQSFMVIVDVPYLTTRSLAVRSHNIPGKFTCYQDPCYPLFVGYGRVAEYWKNEDDGYWSVNVIDSYKRNYLLTEQKIRSLKNTSDQVNPMKPFMYSRGSLLEIGGYRV